MEPIVTAIVFLTPVFLLFFWIGHRRIRFGTGMQAAAMCAVTLLAAWLCYLIGDAQSGAFLAGIIGFIMMLVLLVGAAGLAAGAVTAVLRASGKGGGPRRSFADLIVFGLFLSAALLASLLEGGGSGGHH